MPRKVTAAKKKYKLSIVRAELQVFVASFQKMRPFVSAGHAP